MSAARFRMSCSEILAKELDAKWRTCVCVQCVLSDQ